MDNYERHENGRIWCDWDPNKIDVKCIKITSQLVHCGMFDFVGNFMYWLTAIYAHNELEKRKTLWNDIEAIHRQQQGPWILLGDFNNVLQANDRIGGKIVTEMECLDLSRMMAAIGLFEKEGIGHYYTWSNKHTTGTIYSRIDRVLGNLAWFDDNANTMLQNLPAGVLDHAMLCLTGPNNSVKRTPQFRFLNCLVEMEDYEPLVMKNWSTYSRETYVYIME